MVTSTGMTSTGIREIVCLVSHLLWKRGLPRARLSPATRKLLRHPAPALGLVLGPRTHPLTGKDLSRPGLSKICGLASEHEDLASAVLSLSFSGARRPWAPKDPQIGRWRRWSNCLPKDTGLWFGHQGPSSDTARAVSAHLSQA